jgi:putative ATPase
VPPHLRDAHYPGAKQLQHGRGYRYPHDYPGGVVAQQYAPDTVAGRIYYEPSGQEPRIAARLEYLREVLGTFTGPATPEEWRPRCKPEKPAATSE